MMHAMTATFGIAMLALIGTAVVLGLVVLVMYEVRWIVRNSHAINHQEPMPRQHFSDVPPSSLHLLDDNWQN
jgi:hypothetical protein